MWVMLLGIAYLYSLTGTLNFREIMYSPETLDMLATTSPIILGGWTASAASIIGIFLIIGTVGKSAQFPAACLAAGRYGGSHTRQRDDSRGGDGLRGHFLVAAPVSLVRGWRRPAHGIMTEPLAFMAVVGAFTALLAATMAVAQNDVKAVLAYSTISQLGFMMAALGIGAYIAAHSTLSRTPSSRRCCSWRLASVIHGMEHGEHHVHEHGPWTRCLPSIPMGDRGGFAF